MENRVKTEPNLDDTFQMDSSGNTNEQADNYTLPSKSKKIYDRVYIDFKKWCSNRDFESVNEDVLILYFTDKSESKKSSTLWSMYSMIKSSLLIRENINIKSYKNLLGLLKKCSEGYVATKSSVFTRQQIEYFLSTAPDHTHLMTKVATIIAVSGACRCNELVNLSIDDVSQDHNKNIIVNINYCKKSRAFPIIHQHYIDLCKQYIALRPDNTPHRRFFIFYAKGKCTIQPVGKNKFGQLGISIAKYLQLDSPETYTGHCFRRTSATLLANSGCCMTPAKL